MIITSIWQVGGCECRGLIIVLTQLAPLVTASAVSNGNCLPESYTRE